MGHSKHRQKSNPFIIKLHTFVGHNNEVNLVSWSPKNSLQFASGGSDNRIVIWYIEKLNDSTQNKNGN
jgi:WD40 repeat protein